MAIFPYDYPYCMAINANSGTQQVFMQPQVLRQSKQRNNIVHCFKWGVHLTIGYCINTVLNPEDVNILWKYIGILILECSVTGYYVFV